MTENGEELERPIEHPLPKGSILQCTSDREGVENLLEVLKRFKNIDTGEFEYELSCPSHTGYYQYHQEDVEDLFVDTGLRNDEVKPILDDEIRAAYQELCSHSWHETVGGGFQCPHCRMTVPYPDDDQCEECGDDELTGLVGPEAETARLVCSRHGVLLEVEAVAQ